MTRPRIEIAASILTADFGHLDRVVRKLERAGVDRLHLDVMDGHFVPNITFGPDVVAAFRRLTTLPMDVHLMIAEPSRYVPRFVDAGADTVTFHVEVEEPDDVKAATIGLIRDAGRGGGLAVDPDTPIEAVLPFLPGLDIIMVMTVHPGFGGQRFIAEAAPKMTKAAAWLEDRSAREPDGDRPGHVHVDGGVSHDTASLVGAYGADVCIVGSALFQRGLDTAREVELVRRRAEEGRRQGAPTTADEPVAALPRR
jgi:ribulose-phosphate 3-epimerase